MTLDQRSDAPTCVKSADADRIALALRLGLALVFITGGWWKLSRALDPERSTALVSRYLADDGYINAFFQQFLFADPGAVLTPLGFLIILSAFELVSGIFLLAGLLVRPLSFIFAFLMWSFVIALPVVTTATGGAGEVSHFSPALLVQIRDVALSGMFFVLFNLGSGAFSADRALFRRGQASANVNWDGLGLLLRLSVAAVFVVGGVFAGSNSIKSFVDLPLLLVAIGVLMASGHGVRVAASAALIVLAVYCYGKLSLDATFWDNMNAIKRELALFAASGVLLFYEGGRGFRLAGLLRAPSSSLLGKRVLG